MLLKLSGYSDSQNTTSQISPGVPRGDRWGIIVDKCITHPYETDVRIICKQADSPARLFVSEW